VYPLPTALDSNISFNYIKIDDDAQKIYTIVFPWNMEKYKIQTLTHGYQECLALDNFQNVIPKLVQDIDGICYD
jgi:hypothetical protein